jgi:hypothetical protein
VSLYLINVALVSCILSILDLASGFAKFDVNEKESCEFLGELAVRFNFGLGSTY